METPAITSITKWFAVATTARVMATGMRIANPRTSRCLHAPYATMPTSRFHPAWKLGIAAYSFTNEGGRIWR